MVVEEELRSMKELEPQSDQKNQIGWVACVNQIEPMASVDFTRQPPLVPKRSAILAKVSSRGTYLGGEWMAVDMNAVNFLVEGIVLAACRTDHRDVVPVLP